MGPTSVSQSGAITPGLRTVFGNRQVETQPSPNLAKADVRQRFCRPRQPWIMAAKNLMVFSL
jgi:hypothetical protein